MTDLTLPANSPDRIPCELTVERLMRTTIDAARMKPITTEDINNVRLNAQALANGFTNGFIHCPVIDTFSLFLGTERTQEICQVICKKMQMTFEETLGILLTYPPPIVVNIHILLLS